MFERFTERARQVMVLAQREARQMKHPYIDTEHLLLGLLREEQGAAARTLDQLGIQADQVRARVLELHVAGEEESTGQIPFTQDVKEVLELALREALSLGHNYNGTEHLLLGLVAQKADTLAKRILVEECGTSPETVKQGVLNVLNRKPASAPAGQVTVQAPPSVQELNYGEMPSGELRRLIIKATNELARRVDLSS